MYKCRMGIERRRLRQKGFWIYANCRCAQRIPKTYKLPGFGRLKRQIRDISNSWCLDRCVESCDHTLAACQAAVFAVFFFDFDNGAAVVLAACLTAAQRLICA